MASPTLSSEQQKSLWDSAEQQIKVGTGLLALVYAVGFLIVSVHHGRYGIVMFEFLRARVFAAGILATLFVLWPVYTLLTIKAVGDRRRWLVLVAVTLIWAALSGWMSGVSRPAEIIGSPLFFLSRPVLRFTAWFLLMTWCLRIVYRSLPGKRFEPYVWPIISLLGVAVIVAFSAFMYGDVLPSWGGGMPMPVTIHLSHKTAFSDVTDFSAYLVDETERGYYLIHKSDDHKASFLPREAVASVDFEEMK